MGDRFYTHEELAAPGRRVVDGLNQAIEIERRVRDRRQVDREPVGVSV